MKQNPASFCELAPMLAVPEVAATAQFYQDKLGFEIEFVMDDPTLPKYGIVHREGFCVHLIEGNVDAAPGSKGGINVSVDNVDQLYEELKKRGAFSETFPTGYDAIREHPPEDKEYGRRDLIMVDPNGYVLVFGQSLEED